VSGNGVKAFVVSGLVAGLLVSMSSAIATPAAAQENLTGRVLAEICLPYANRAQSFEKSIRAARDLKFRRPADERGTPLDEWASEVDLVSRDGTWRLHLEEGTVEFGDTEVYAVTCALSSTRASANELADLGRRAFRNERYWSTDQASPRQWDRRSANPDEYRLEVRVIEDQGSRPALTIRGLYF
jgi:hypothetical protein